ncbi:unnamed protein product [Moneuplotes crassus]|uniref:MRH domain-containing protein n=1 Tax=Euplotes crassus TaxID=5936 RepID=A0AAD2D481_EUPCR|nr:unnamed protein product [Moneuplotes crassus]
MKIRFETLRSTLLLMAIFFIVSTTSEGTNSCVFTNRDGEEYNLSMFGGEHTVLDRNTKDDLSFKFDLCNPHINCGDNDLVVHESIIGFLEIKQSEDIGSCRKFEELNDYTFNKVKHGHELIFTSFNACPENYYPKDLKTVFRFTCDVDSPSRNKFMSIKTGEPCTRIFEVVSGEACNIHFNGSWSLNFSSKSFKNLVNITILAAMIGSSLFLVIIFVRNKSKNEKSRYRSLMKAV